MCSRIIVKSLSVVLCLLAVCSITIFAANVNPDNKSISPDETSSADKDPQQVCGDASGDMMVSMLDIPFLDSYIFDQGSAPSTYLDANADGCAGPNVAVNIADIVPIVNYVYFMGPAPSGCANTTDCSQVVAGNEIRVGDPPYTAYPGGDSVMIPLYITTSTTMAALTVALEYTSLSGETVTSVNWTGSVFNPDIRDAYFNTAGKQVLLGGHFTVSGSMSSQSDALFATLNAQVTGGKAGEDYSFSKSFVTPAGEFIFVTTGGLIYDPALTLPATPIVVTNTDDSGDGSLRWAITEANNNPGLDTIYFDVSGTLSPVTQLPALTDDSTVILGSSAPSGARSFIIDGGGENNGLDVLSSYNQIKDIIVYDFSLYHIRINGDSNIVRGCYINLDETGDNPVVATYGIFIQAGRLNIIGGCNADDANVIGASSINLFNYGNCVSVGGNKSVVAGNFLGVKPNGTDYYPLCNVGIICWSDSNMIGGEAAECRNVIFGRAAGITLWEGEYNEIYNNFIGLTESGDDILVPSSGLSNVGITDTAYAIHNNIGGPDGKGNFIAGCYQGIVMWEDSNDVMGNYIGTDTTGRIGLGQYGNGISLLWYKNNRIGDTLSGYANIIGSCQEYGIKIESSDSNVISGNYIGTNPQGDDLGNYQGIKVEGGNYNIIFRNRVCNSDWSGIAIDSLGTSIRNTISQNQIYNNGLLGIDLRDDGVTSNDIGDDDTGPNDLVNYPYIDSVFMDPDSSFRIYGTNNADSAIIEFFVAHPGGDSTRHADPTGHGEAYQYIGTDTANIPGSFSFVIPNTIPQFSKISMTATDTFGNTSEFSENFTLTPGPLIIVGYSPINLQVTDPEGGFIGRDAYGVLTQTIFFASYTDIDNDSIHIDYPLLGEYIIDVIAEDGAEPGSIYSIGIRIDGTANCVIVMDALIPAAGEVTSYGYDVEEGYHYVNGDADRNGIVNVLDVIFLIDYKFKGGPAPDPLSAGDADCDDNVNIIDMIYLIDYKFKGGPEPCPLVE